MLIAPIKRMAYAEWLSERGIENSSIKLAYRNRPLGKEDNNLTG